MNKKIVIRCIGIVIILASITMVSAVSTTKKVEKESPLFKFRA